MTAFVPRRRGARPWESEEKSPLAQAREVVRRGWREFDRTLGRKYDLLVVMRDRALTPGEVDEIGRKLATLDTDLRDLDAELVLSEARLAGLQRSNDAPE